MSFDRNSFTGDTTVLMADGTRKPIKDVQLGDEVLATNPLTGETAAKEVTDVRSYETDSTLFEVHVGTDSGVGKIVATDEHPFWVTTVGRWVGTEDLKPGYRFLTADNRPATVLGKRTFAGAKLVYNLTVDGLHTYFVGAAGRKTAAADVLVHNDDPRVFAVDSCGETESLPVHEIDSSVHGPMASNHLKAIAEGAPAILTKLDGEKNQRKNRNHAQAHAPRPLKFARNATWEEYPFASSYEGGTGAVLTLAPRTINSSHGNALKQFYRRNSITNGDKFVVRVK